MKLSSIVALFALSATVNAFWTAAVQPVVLSIGAVFAAFGSDLLPMLDVQPIGLKRLLTFKNEKDEKSCKNTGKEEEGLNSTDKDLEEKPPRRLEEYEEYFG